MIEQPSAALCAVCGEEIAPGMSASCNWCDATYHLNQRNDVEAKDCGTVWIDEQYLALQFACNTCLDSGTGPSHNGVRSPGRESRSGRTASRPRRYKRRT